MPTTHTWNGRSNVYLFDPANYLDGTAFAAGDTLVISSGEPSIASSSANVAALTTGTFQFTIPSGSAGLDTDNLAIDAASTNAVSGPGTFNWYMQDQFVNNGAIQVGSAAALGNSVISMSPTRPATLTNRGSIAVQNGSLFKLKSATASGAFVNAAGAVLSISSGGQLASGSAYGYSGSGIGNLNTTNNGVIEVTGPPDAPPAPISKAATRGLACSPYVARRDHLRQMRKPRSTARPAASSTWLAASSCFTPPPLAAASTSWTTTLG